MKRLQTNLSSGDYQGHFNQLIKLIQEFQTLEISSSVFQFLEQISPYDYTATHKKEILQNEYQHLWKFSQNFDDILRKFRAQLKNVHLTSKPKESKRIAEELEKSLLSLGNKLTEAKVKNKVISNITEDNMYKQVEHFGIKMRELKPHIWKEFKHEKVDESYLFDDYFGWLYDLFLYIGYVVDEFASGYKGLSTIEQNEKINSPVFVKKPKADLKQIIFPSRWDEFIKWCDYYTEVRAFDIGVLKKKAITFDDKTNRYLWQPIGRGKNGFPELGAFISALHGKNYFQLMSAGSRQHIFLCFLDFFFEGKHTIQQAKDLGKYVSTKKNRYKGWFQLS